MATTKKIFLSVFMHEIAIIKKEEAVKIVTIPTLVICFILTQQAPFTSRDEAPKIIMKNRNRPIKLPSSKSVARSEAAA